MVAARPRPPKIAAETYQQKECVMLDHEGFRAAADKLLSVACSLFSSVFLVIKVPVVIAESSTVPCRCLTNQED